MSTPPFPLPDLSKVIWHAATVSTPSEVLRNVPSKKVIKQQMRPFYERYCEACRKQGILPAGVGNPDAKDIEEKVKLSKCSKCQDTYYCSMKCQKEHWPLHKNLCHRVASVNIQKMVQLFWAHRWLRGYLEVYTIMVYNILNLEKDKTVSDKFQSSSPNSASSRNPNLKPRPYLLRIDIGLEPEITEFMELFHGQKQYHHQAPQNDHNQKGKKKSYDDSGRLLGMFQVTSLTHSKEYNEEYFTRTAETIGDGSGSRKEEGGLGRKAGMIWAVEDELELASVSRTKPTAFKSKNGLPVVLFEFVFRGDLSQSLTMMCSLSPQAMEIARKREPLPKISSIRGRLEDECTPETTIESLNGVIRDDKANTLLLRFPIKPIDIEIIRAAGRRDTGYLGGRAVENLLVKVERDTIYTSFAYIGMC